MLIKLLIIAISIIYINAIKNPCRINSPVEFHPHPESVNSYIQCSKRGQMFVKQCVGNTVWSDSQKKCAEKKEANSQITTLANKYKISKLLAKKPLDNKNLTVSEEKSESETLKKNKADQEKRLEEIAIEQRNIAQEELGQKVIDQIQDQLRNREQIQVIDQMNKQTALEKNGQKVIDQTLKDQKANQIEQLRQQLALQKELIAKTNFWAHYHKNQQLPNESPIEEDPIENEHEMMQLKQEATTMETITTTSTPEPTPLEKAQLENQAAMLNKIKSEQKLREELQLKHQRLMHDFISNQRKHDEKSRINEHKKTIQQQILEQSSQLQSQIKQQELKNKMHQQRLLKEKEMCSKVMCPSSYRCALDKDDTLACLPINL